MKQREWSRRYRESHIEYGQKYREAHRDELRIKGRRYYAAHRENARAYRRHQRVTNNEVVNAYHRNYSAMHRERLNELSRRNHAKLRADVLSGYDGKCADCGEMRAAFLTLDHVYNDGAQHRKGLEGGGVYRWARRHKFPPSLQILCWNCNIIKQVLHRHANWTEEKMRIYSQMSDAYLKQDVISAYGSQCVCCGETRSDVLVLDHVNNDGAKHRRLVSVGHKKPPRSFGMWRWARKNHFPDSLRLLCFNCNGARQYSGQCPHEIERIDRGELPRLVSTERVKSCLHQL